MLNINKLYVLKTLVMLVPMQTANIAKIKESLSDA